MNLAQDMALPFHTQALSWRPPKFIQRGVQAGDTQIVSGFIDEQSIPTGFQSRNIPNPLINMPRAKYTVSSPLFPTWFRSFNQTPSILPKSQPDIDNHSKKQECSQERWSPPVVEPPRGLPSDGVRPPVKRVDRVSHGQQSYDHEASSADATDVVSEVQKAD